MRKPLLALGFLAVSAAAWAGYWWHTADEGKTQLASAITAYNDALTASGSSFQITYESIEASHFLGLPHLQVIEPVLKNAATVVRHWEARAPRITVIPETADFHRIRLELPESAHLLQRFGKDVEQYTIELPRGPRYSLRTAALAKAADEDGGPLAGLTADAPPALSFSDHAYAQFALRQPKPVKLRLTSGGVTHDATFAPSLPPVQLWRNVATQLDTSFSLLFGLLAEIRAEREATLQR